jgi:hypothetical protein
MLSNYNIVTSIIQLNDHLQKLDNNYYIYVVTWGQILCQEFPCNLWVMNANCCMYRSWSLVSILSQKLCPSLRPCVTVSNKLIFFFLMKCC